MKKNVKTYAELAHYITGFKDGHFNLIVLIGSAGLQKSTLVEQVLERSARYLRGTVSPFQLYRELYEHLNSDFVIDDVDSLYADRSAVRLLKSLCETRTTKTVSWHTASSQLKHDNIPTQFDTESRVVIIANEWEALNENVGALEDRGTVIHFQPSASEVHVRVQSWFQEKEIYDFIGQHLIFIRKPSMRFYIEALAHKKAGMDWKSVLLESWGVNKNTMLVARLMDDQTLAQEQRAARFIEMTGSSRRTFFRILGRLGQVSRTAGTLALSESTE